MPKGRKTGGRRAGTPNKVTGIREYLYGLAGPNGRLYVDKVHVLATEPHSDPHLRLKALLALLERGWGKPTEHVELTGQEGGPIEVHDHLIAPAAH